MAPRPDARQAPGGRAARRRVAGALAAGLGLLGVLAALDWLPPGAEWFAAHPMTAAALSTIVGFLAVGLLVQSWIRERDAMQLLRISSVAYRSLAQTVNDVGRSLLAPLVGADLAALAVPSASGEGADAVLARLDRHGIAPSFRQSTGSWRGVGDASHGAVLRALAADPDFVQTLFRTAATSRRWLHDATATWSPVMTASRWSSDDLGRLRELTDAVELLQERCRLAGVVPQAPAGWAPEPAWLDCLAGDFWRAISAYERLRDDFAELAALPSDEIVERRG